MNARHALPDDFDVSRDRELLGAYLLDLADADETRRVEHRLAVDAAYRSEMEELRQMTDLLGEVPPEAFLDGPPDADLVLQRALRRIRDPEYRGTAATVEDYLRESIVDPSAFVSDPPEGRVFATPDGVSLMPGDYGNRLTDQQIGDLVAYLTTLREQEAQP